MPPFLPVVLAGVALYGAFRWASRQLAAQSAKAAQQQHRHPAASARDQGTLELDAKENVYRPKD